MYLDWLEKSKNAQYRRLFYYTSPDHLISNLSNKRIKISQFDRCNDIFELASFDLRDRRVRDRHRKWLEQCTKCTGLICLSEDWRNHLMWGHYAKSGTGVCLVFDVCKKNLKKVSYISEREQVSSDYEFPKPESDKNFFSACSKKSTQWGYEKEHRYFVDYSQNGVVFDSGKKFLNFSESFELVGFINGPNPELSVEEILSSGCGKLRYFQCRASFKEFRMVVQQNKKRWRVESGSNDEVNSK